MIKWAFALAVVGLLSGCGYNTIQKQDEQTKAAWSEVLNQYQRRADLIPNLVNTVKGYAQHEDKVFTEVTEARARVGNIQINADDPDSLAKFQAAQGQLTGALSRLMAVSENYPDLKASGLFQNLQAQPGKFERVAVFHWDKFVLGLGSRAKPDVRAAAVAQLEMSGDKVGVEVSQKNVADLHAQPLGIVQVLKNAQAYNFIHGALR